MAERFAHTFDEYVGWMAVNSPHATVLDWWRRLDRGLDEYAPAPPPRPRRHRWRALESALTADPCFGPMAVELLRAMRVLRNRVAHEPGVYLSPQQAALYAQLALQFIGSLGARRALPSPPEDWRRLVPPN